MTHTRTYSQFEGDLTPTEVDDAKPVDRACIKCGKAGAVVHQNWESSCGGYVDSKFTCTRARGGCGHIWWIDGIDS